MSDAVDPVSQILPYGGEEERLRRLAATIPGMLYDYVLNPDGSSKFLYVGPKCREVLEIDEIDLLADAGLFWDLIVAEDLERLKAEDVSANRKGVSFDAEVRIRTRSGTVKWIQLSSRPNPAPPGTTVVWSGFMLDITERKKAEGELRQSEERFRSIFECAADPVLLISMDGYVQDANQEACRTYGYTRAEFIGKHGSEFVQADHINVFSDAVATIKSGHNFSAESVDVRKDGRSFPVEVHVAPLGHQNEPMMLCFIRDITERKQLEQQITQLAFYDTLTKLPNRRLLGDRLQQTVAASKRRGCHGALMFLDLDNFKPLNDTHGHEAGDQLLIEAARRIKGCIRETDTVSRLGGDEFVVLINELTADRAASASEATVIAEKIRNALGEPYLLAPRGGSQTGETINHQCTVSIGVTLFMNHEADSADIIKRADAAMYEAKRAGRNQIRIDDV